MTYGTTWEYLRIVLFEDANSIPGQTEPTTRTYASVQRAGRSERIDLWTYWQTQRKFDVHKSIIDLLSDFGSEGWELISALPATRGAQQAPTSETFHFKRPR